MISSRALDPLFASLDLRPRPEDVADLILDVLGPQLTKAERSAIDAVARGSLKRSVTGFSSMMADFHRPIAPHKSMKKAHELFASAASLRPLTAVEWLDASVVRERVAVLGREIQRGLGVPFGARMNRAQRKSVGVEHGKRRYNKLFRLLLRLEDKVTRYARAQRIYRATRVAKAGLSTTIAREDFDSCAFAAAFCAYAAARKNRRSEFTNQAQDRFYDSVCSLLLARVDVRDSKAWRAIARVMPDASVIKHLDERSRLELFGAWASTLAELATLLKETWEKKPFARDTMIVQRGDDSSTWNALAGAWNEARRGYFSVAYALGLDDSLEHACFGKVMRLMAADVAYWHRRSGGGLEPDTLVWAELPAPWEVFGGARTCSKKLVENVCKKHGVENKGWTAPVTRARDVAPFKPTPELVHGVTIAHPALAVVLKRAGAFSGKAVRAPLPDVIITRDVHGAALRVDEKKA